MNNGVSRQDQKLFEEPSKAMLAFRLFIDLAMLAVFTVVVAQAILLNLGWTSALCGGAGIFLAALLGHGDLVHHKMETVLRRRVLYYANRALYAEAENSRLRRVIDLHERQAS